MASAPRPCFAGPGRHFKLESAAFGDGATIPRLYTADGANVSPPLAWGNVPAAAGELVLLVEDLDAYTADPWVHWLVYGIPARSGGLAERWTAAADGPRAGLNSWSGLGYRGPQPPPGSGPHRYRFRLIAADSPVTLPAGARRQQVLDALAGHVVAEAVLVGTYGR